MLAGYYKRQYKSSALVNIASYKVCVTKDGGSIYVCMREWIRGGETTKESFEVFLQLPSFFAHSLPISHRLILFHFMRALFVLGIGTVIYDLVSYRDLEMFCLLDFTPLWAFF